MKNNLNMDSISPFSDTPRHKPQGLRHVIKYSGCHLCLLMIRWLYFTWNFEKKLTVNSSYDNSHPGIVIFIVILSTLICRYGWNHKPWCIHIYSVSFFEFTWLNLCHLLLALSKKPNITSWFSVQNFTHETLYSAFEYSCEKCCFWPHSPETVKFVLFLVVSEIVKCTFIQTEQLQPKLMHQKSSSFEFVIFPFQLWIFAGRCIKGFVC